MSVPEPSNTATFQVAGASTDDGHNTTLPEEDKPDDKGSSLDSIDWSGQGILKTHSNSDVMTEKQSERPPAESSMYGQVGDAFIVPKPLRSFREYDAFLDEETGHEYFYNRRTNESTWIAPYEELLNPRFQAYLLLSKLMYNPYDPDQPHPLSSQGDWSLYLDEESLNLYYCNDETGESCWECPPDWDPEKAMVPPLAVLSGHMEGEWVNLLSGDEGNPTSTEDVPTASIDHETQSDLERKPPMLEQSNSDTNNLAGTVEEVVSKDHVEADELCAQPDEGQKDGSTINGTMEKIAISQEQDPNPLPEKEVDENNKLWFVYRDFETLQQYFTNPETHATVWEPPRAIACLVVDHEFAPIQPGKWQEYVHDYCENENSYIAKVHEWEIYEDATTGHMYYHNVSSGETTWDIPNEVRTATAEEFEAGDTVLPEVTHQPDVDYSGTQEIVATNQEDSSVDIANISEPVGTSTATEVDTSASPSTTKPTLITSEETAVESANDGARSFVESSSDAHTVSHQSASLTSTSVSTEPQDTQPSQRNKTVDDEYSGKHDKSEEIPDQPQNHTVTSEIDEKTHLDVAPPQPEKTVDNGYSDTLEKLEKKPDQPQEHAKKVEVDEKIHLGKRDVDDKEEDRSSALEEDLPATSSGSSTHQQTLPETAVTVSSISSTSTTKSTQEQLVSTQAAATTVTKAPTKELATPKASSTIVSNEAKENSTDTSKIASHSGGKTSNHTSPKALPTGHQSNSGSSPVSNGLSPTRQNNVPAETQFTSSIIAKAKPNSEAPASPVAAPPSQKRKLVGLNFFEGPTTSSSGGSLQSFLASVQGKQESEKAETSAAVEEDVASKSETPSETVDTTTNDTETEHTKTQEYKAVPYTIDYPAAPPKPSSNPNPSFFGFGALTGVVRTKKYKSKPLPPEMSVTPSTETQTNPPEQDVQEDQETETIKEKVMKAKETKELETAEAKELDNANLDGDNNERLNTLHTLSGICGLSPQDMAKSLERFKATSNGQVGILCWVQTHMKKLKTQLRNAEAAVKQLEGDSSGQLKEAQEKVSKINDSLKQLQEWERKERERRRKMNTEMEEKLQQMKEQEEQQVASKREKIQQQKEKYKQRLEATKAESNKKAKKKGEEERKLVEAKMREKKLAEEEALRKKRERIRAAKGSK